MAPIIDAMYRAHRKRVPAWDEAHYADWTREDLVWRLMFLQDAGAYTWCAEQYYSRWLLPIACFVSALIGLWLGLGMS